MPGILNLSSAPFSALNAQERQRLRRTLDLARFAEGETVKEADAPWPGLLVVLRGRVVGREGKGATRVFGPDEVIGGRDLVRGKLSREFKATEETVCLRVPTDTVEALIRRNTGFRTTLAGEGVPMARPDMLRGESDGFAVAKVSEADIQKAETLPADRPAEEGAKLLRGRKSDCLLVKRDGRYGMVTGTDLLAVASGETRGAVLGDLATWDLVTIGPGDFVFDALIRMTSHQLDRLVVMDGETLVGVLEINEVLGLLSTQSHSLGIRIQRAENLGDLRAASRATDELVRALVDRGVGISRIVDLLAALNGRIMARLFRMCVPAEVLGQACLIVMGSEGRGEQILKTDQDNAVVMADGLEWPDRETHLQRFSDGLSELGYPPCPGNFMVTNPDWVMSVSQWMTRLDGWMERADGDAMLNLTVVSDAHVVTGNAALWAELDEWLLDRFHAGAGFMSTFVHPVIRFTVPLNFFGRIRNPDEGIDVKKGAVFPLVHGVRSLALDARIGETNTFRRIAQLVARGELEAATGEDLAAALETVMLIRLQQQLEALAAGQDPDNLVRPAGLSNMERDRLQRALRIVKGFQTSLARRYHLEI